MQAAVLNELILVAALIVLPMLPALIRRITVK